MSACHAETNDFIIRVGVKDKDEFDICQWLLENSYHLRRFDTSGLLEVLTVFEDSFVPLSMAYMRDKHILIAKNAAGVLRAVYIWHDSVRRDFVRALV